MAAELARAVTKENQIEADLVQAELDYASADSVVAAAAQAALTAAFVSRDA